MGMWDWVLKKNRKKTPSQFQMEVVECGAVCLYMIMGYYKRFIPLEQLRIDCGVSRDGCEAINLIQAAGIHGFDAEGYRIHVDEFDTINFPCIAFWHFNHFVVVEGYSDQYFYINDPAYGHRRTEREDFIREYSGVILEFTPNQNFKPEGSPPNIYNQLLTRLSDQKMALAYVFLVGLALTILGLAAPIFGKIFVDVFLIDHTQSVLKILIFGILFTSILRIILSFLSNHYLAKLENKLNILFSEKILWKVLRLPLIFFSQRSMGDIISRIQSIRGISNFIGNVYIDGVLSAILIVIYLGLLLFYDKDLSLIIIFIACLNVGIFYFISSVKKEKSLLCAVDYGNYISQCFSSLRIIESIKASGAEQNTFKKNIGLQVKVSNAIHDLAEKTILISGVPIFLNALSQVTIIIIGTLKIMNGDMTVGTLVAIQSIAANLMMPLNNLINISSKIQEMVGKMAKLDDVLEHKLEEKVNLSHFSQSEHLAKEDKVKLVGYIEIKGLTFGYNSLQPPCIDELNLIIYPGEHVAFIGSSGSGKSTLSHLIANLYHPWHGTIDIDGLNINHINKMVFANSLVLVQQNNSFFHGTIKDNLTMWDQTISFEKIVLGAKEAYIHDEISSRQNGYETILSENGANFSGGERQRIELARAIIANPSILILDEATSELDPIVENQIYDSIRKIGCTTIIIAHRLDTIINADKIIVLDKGQIVQIGTHSELISKPGLYLELMKTL